jgi:hypothetical protein
MDGDAGIAMPRKHANRDLNRGPIEEGSGMEQERRGIFSLPSRAFQIMLIVLRYA